MLDEIFESIKERIKTTVPEIKACHIYQQQEIFTEKNKGTSYPIILIEYLSPITYNTLNSLVQEADLSINARIITEDYTSDYLKVFKLKNKVVRNLHNWSDWSYPLNRVSESTDITADSLYSYTIQFDTRFIEEINDSYCVEPIDSFTVNLSLESNGDNIYSGWASTSSNIII